MTYPPQFGEDPQVRRVYAGPGVEQQQGGRRAVNAGRLWTGGIMAAIVAAGVAVVGLLIARGIADVAVLVEKDGQLVNAETWWYALAAVAGAVLATGLLNVLLLWSPRPYLFFGWIVGLATAVAALLPYTSEAAMGSRVATSVINLAIGICIANAERTGDRVNAGTAGARAATLDRAAVAPIVRGETPYERAVREALASEARSTKAAAGPKSRA